MNKNFFHEPVLVKPIIDLLQPQKEEIYLDLTAGGGGHALKIVEKESNIKLILNDRDQDAINQLKQVFANKTNVKILKNDFLSTARNTESESVDMILLDLGVSSQQLDDSERGFSFRFDADLDMRMDGEQTFTAKEIVNRWKEEDIAEIIKEYGEERHYKKVAKAIVQNRPFGTTEELAQVIRKNTSDPKIDPATRTFQALRIAVNDELNQLKEVLPECVRILKKNGRLAVISFHSLEDRIVKHFFKEMKGGLDHGLEKPKIVQILTKKPVIADRDEILQNNRSRSAKLRVIQKIS